MNLNYAVVHGRFIGGKLKSSHPTQTISFIIMSQLSYFTPVVSEQREAKIDRVAAKIERLEDKDSLSGKQQAKLARLTDKYDRLTPDDEFLATISSDARDATVTAILIDSPYDDTIVINPEKRYGFGYKAVRNDLTPAYIYERVVWIIDSAQATDAVTQVMGRTIHNRKDPECFEESIVFGEWTGDGLTTISSVDI